PGQYLELHRAWRSGDTVSLTLPIPVQRVESHPHVSGNQGCVALRRGPLIYCLEAVDHPGVEVRDILLPAEAALEAYFGPDLLGGVVAVSADAVAVAPAGWDGRLYRAVVTSRSTTREGAARERKLISLQAIPYYAWANRAPGAMQVWIRT